MKQGHSLLTLTILAVSAIAAHRFIGVDGDLPADGGNAYGVTRSDAGAGDLAPIDVAGTTVVETAGAIGAGGLIETDDEGLAVALSEGKAVARMAPGQAAALGPGEFVEVILIPN